MTPAERRKHKNTFHVMTWMQKQIESKIAVLACSEQTERNLGARSCAEHLLKLLREKRQAIITTKAISRR